MVLALYELSRAGRSPAAAGRQSGHAPEHLSGAAPKSRPDSASPDAQLLHAAEMLALAQHPPADAPVAALSNLDDSHVKHM